jgi:hypothetical protein
MVAISRKEFTTEITEFGRKKGEGSPVGSDSIVEITHFHASTGSLIELRFPSFSLRALC